MMNERVQGCIAETLTGKPLRSFRESIYIRKFAYGGIVSQKKKKEK